MFGIGWECAGTINRAVAAMITADRTHCLIIGALTDKSSFGKVPWIETFPVGRKLSKAPLAQCVWDVTWWRPKPMM